MISMAFGLVKITFKDTVGIFQSQWRVGKTLSVFLSSKWIASDLSSNLV